MIHINMDTDRVPLTAAQGRSILQAETDSFGVFLNLDRINEYVFYFRDRVIQREVAIEAMTGQRVLTSDKPGKIALLNALGAHLGTSLTIPALTELSKSDDKILALVAKFMMENSQDTNRIQTLKKWAQLPQSELRGKRGERLVVAHPQWHVLNTSRLSTSDPNVQGLPRDMKDLIVEPEGYTLVRCDSSQIEPRINFSYFIRDELVMNLIKCYNDAYFGIMEYVMLSDEDVTKYRANFSLYQKKEVSDELKSRRQSIKTLTNAGSYGGGMEKLVSLAGDSRVAYAYKERIINHPKRMAFEQRVREQVSRGDYTFHSAFGTPVTPEIKKPEDNNPEHLVRCGINNPVQTTAADLMMFSLDKASKLINSSEDSHICFYKHDEGCFYISDNDKGLIDELKDITAYQVDGWIEIPSDTEYGIVQSSYPSYL